MVALGVSSGYAMKPLSIRLTPRQIAWLDSCRAEGEPRSMVVRRLLGGLMEERRVAGGISTGPRGAKVSKLLMELSSNESN
jgi:hypothetical protein